MADAGAPSSLMLPSPVARARNPPMRLRGSFRTAFASLRRADRKRQARRIGRHLKGGVFWYGRMRTNRARNTRPRFAGNLHGLGCEVSIIEAMAIARGL